MIEAGGVTIYDDTYNSNPAGAKAALRLLEKHAVTSWSRVSLEGHGRGSPAGWYGDAVMMS